MTKAKGETARRQLGRISVLERRMRQLVTKRYKTPSNIAEISAIEWAIPVLEKYVRDKYGDLPMRTKYYKHEKNSILYQLWTRDGDICYLCGVAMDYQKVTIDHVLPLAKGGKDEMANYRLVHEFCNLEKGNMTLEQFAQSKEDTKT